MLLNLCFNQLLHPGRNWVLPV